MALRQYIPAGVMVERVCGKDRFWAWSERVTEW